MNLSNLCWWLQITTILSLSEVLNRITKCLLDIFNVFPQIPHGIPTALAVPPAKACNHLWPCLLPQNSFPPPPEFLSSPSDCSSKYNSSAFPTWSPSLYPRLSLPGMVIICNRFPAFPNVGLLTFDVACVCLADEFKHCFNFIPTFYQFLFLNFFKFFAMSEVCIIWPKTFHLTLFNVILFFWKVCHVCPTACFD